MTRPRRDDPIPRRRILDSILLIRGQKVILDSSLAEMYGVQTGALIQAVKRNPGRFPDDFMVRLTKAELAGLKSQNVMSSSWGGRRTLPYAFTEQGVAMLSSVLRSQRAVAVNVESLDALEQRYDQQFRTVFEAIRALISEDIKPRKRIGFA